MKRGRPPSRTTILRAPVRRSIASIRDPGAVAALIGEIVRSRDYGEQHGRVLWEDLGECRLLVAGKGSAMDPLGSPTVRRNLEQPVHVRNDDDLLAPCSRRTGSDARKQNRRSAVDRHLSQSVVDIANPPPVARKEQVRHEASARFDHACVELVERADRHTTVR